MCHRKRRQHHPQCWKPFRMPALRSPLAIQRSPKLQYKTRKTLPISLVVLFRRSAFRFVIISLASFIYFFFALFVSFVLIECIFEKKKMISNHIFQNVDESNEPQIINNIQPVQQQQPQQQPVQQYTITLDGKTLKSNQIHYKIEPTGAITIQDPQFVQQAQNTPTQQTAIRWWQRMKKPLFELREQLKLIELFFFLLHFARSNNTYSQVNEFLKLKPANATKVTPILKRKEPTVKIIETSPSKKPKINLVLASPPVQQQPKVQANTGLLQRFASSQNLGHFSNLIIELFPPCRINSYA